MKKEILEEQYERVNAAPPETTRAEYFEYCRLAIALVESGTLNIEKAAYQICGMSARVRDHLKEEDHAIIDIACNLELPKTQRDQSGGSWEILVAKVKALGSSQTSA